MDLNARVGKKKLTSFLLGKYCSLYTNHINEHSATAQSFLTEHTQEQQDLLVTDITISAYHKNKQLPREPKALPGHSVL